MKNRDAKNLFNQFVVVTGMDDKHRAPFTREGTRLIVPYLIGWGVSMSQLTEQIGYSPDAIQKLINSRRDAPGHQDTNWTKWCKGLGLTTDQVADSAFRGGVVGVKIVQAAIAWCKFAGLPQWHTPPYQKKYRDNGKPHHKTFDYELVINSCCSAYNVTRAEIESKARMPDVVMARGLIVAALRTFTFLSYPDISAQMRLPNHSTVITAHQRFSGIWVGAFGPTGPEVTAKLRARWTWTIGILGMPADIQPKHQAIFYSRTPQKIKSA